MSLLSNCSKNICAGSLLDHLSTRDRSKADLMNKIKSHSRSHQVPKNQFYHNSFSNNKNPNMINFPNRHNFSGSAHNCHSGMQGYHSVSPNLSDNIKIETRPRRNEFSKDTNWLNSIQNLRAPNCHQPEADSYQNGTKIFDSSLGKKIERDVFQLIDDDESNLYDPTIENGSPLSKKSKISVNANKGTCNKLKVSLSTQPTQGGSFAMSNLNFDKNLQEIFSSEYKNSSQEILNESKLQKDQPDADRQIIYRNLGQEASLEKRFNPFRAKNDDEISLNRAKFERLDF